VSFALANQIAQVKSGLKAIGYRGGCLREDYAFSDFLGDTPVTRRVHLAAFYQEPPSFDSACFGVITANGDPAVAVRQCTALGAPQILVLSERAVDRWAVRSDRDPERLERIRTDRLKSILREREPIWSPSAIAQAKRRTRASQADQLDFVDLGLMPALEHQAQRKLNDLIVQTVAVAKDAYASNRRGVPFPDEAFLQLLFDLIRAKVLKDSDALPDIDLSVPEAALVQVDEGARQAIRHLGDAEVLRYAADRVAHTFMLDNLSPETLAYVYENTLVTPELRKQLGVHSTPPYVADYILGRLPIEDIPANSRCVLDPTCGRGTLLVAAVRRLRSLMPASMSTANRHAYLKNHVCGIDVLSKACDVARLSLTYADLPNPNGWQTFVQDVFDSGVIEQVASRTRILVGNPPFERFNTEEKERYGPITSYKGSEILLRALPALPSGALVGIVMPRKLLDGHSYASVRSELAASFEIIELTALPDTVFPKSEAETVLLMARKARRSGARPAVYLVRQVRRQDLERFESANEVSWETEIQSDCLSSPTVRKAPNFYFSEFQSLWDYLGVRAGRVRDVAEVHRGVEYKDGMLRKNREVLIRDAPFPGSRPGLASASKQLSPFVIGLPSHLETDPSVCKGGAWEYRWDRPKVITNANRAGRGPWRLVAAPDQSGLLATQTFHGIWPLISDLSLDLLAAVLNGPLANAYVYDHEPAQDNRNETIASVPFPRNWQSVATIVDPLVEAYRLAAAEDRHEDAAVLIERIDSEILRAYSLPPREERRLLDLFWERRRPGVPAFDGYIPPSFSAWVPLHQYLAPEFQRSTDDEIRRRGAWTTDPEIVDFFDQIP